MPWRAMLIGQMTVYDAEDEAAEGWKLEGVARKEGQGGFYLGETSMAVFPSCSSHGGRRGVDRLGRIRPR